MESIYIRTPILDKKGVMIGYLAIDVSADAIDAISSKVLHDGAANFVFNGFFVVILLACVYYAKMVSKRISQRSRRYRGYISIQIQSLLASVHSLRHDFFNHIQVVYGLLKLAEHDKALECLIALFKRNSFHYVDQFQSR